MNTTMARSLYCPRPQRGDSFLQQSLAVKRDFVSLLDAASYGAFENVPLANGFSITDPQIERDEAGIPYETFGFVSFRWIDGELQYL